MYYEAFISRSKSLASLPQAFPKFHYLQRKALLREKATTRHQLFLMFVGFSHFYLCLSFFMEKLNLCSMVLVSYLHLASIIAIKICVCWFFSIEVLRSKNIKWTLGKEDQFMNIHIWMYWMLLAPLLKTSCREVGCFSIGCWLYYISRNIVSSSIGLWQWYRSWSITTQELDKCWNLLCWPGQWIVCGITKILMGDGVLVEEGIVQLLVSWNGVENLWFTLKESAHHEIMEEKHKALILSQHYTKFRASPLRNK